MVLKFLCLLLVFGGALCADSRSIYQYLKDNHQYSELVKLIDSAGIASSLQQPGALTMLAPTNDAIHAVPKAALDEFKNDPTKLKTLLLFHVVNQTLISPLVGDGAVVSTLSGQKVSFHKNGSDVYANGAYLSTTDVILSNGVVHAIDKVLIPATETLVQYLVKHDKMFSDLFAAIVVAHLETALESGDFTLFAPTDVAFSKIKNGLAGDASSLASLLKFHVVPGVYTSDLLKDGMKLHTLEGKDLTVSVSSNGVKVGSATVTDADIAAINGVIHVIDTVQTP